MAVLSGKVEKIDFTQGGAGNQWTTIDGIRYATFWDIRTKNWKVGDTVLYRPYTAALWHGHPEIPHATDIRKVPCEHDFEAKAQDGGALSMCQPVIYLCSKCGEPEET